MKGQTQMIGPFDHWADNKPKPLPFGSTVFVAARLQRRVTYDRASGKSSARWITVDLKQVRVGLLIGYRTLSNGTLVSGLYGLDAYEREESVPAALVVCGPRSAPFYAPVTGVVPAHGRITLGDGLEAHYQGGQLVAITSRTGYAKAVADEA